jgi:hypothetical protein
MNHQAYLPHAESPFVWGMGIIFLGFDPGGVFGVSVLRLPAHGPATAVVGSVRSVDDAPDVLLNETHPKVLYHAMTSKNYTRDDIPTMTARLQQQFRPRVECVIRDAHQWDALISAWATWQGFSGKWIADLVADLGGTRLLFPVGQVSYYWPNVIQA